MDFNGIDLSERRRRPQNGAAKIECSAMSHRRAFAVLCLALAAHPAAADSSVAAQSPGGLILEATRGGSAVRLSRPDGSSRELALPAGIEVNGITELGSHWLISGSAADPGEPRRLCLLLDDGHGTRELAAPRPGAAAIQRRPVPLAEGTELVGLAWLEGAAAGGLGVRAAVWDGGRWSKPEWVARPGKGSQLALSGAVLEDGSWLLVWSAFDGEDDEVVAARRVDGVWEAPRRILADNGVPDITPALALTREGAVAAWSRYDGGGYGLVRALWDGQGWRELAGFDRAGLYPAFRGTAELPALLFFDARRSAWTALELDARGRVLRRAEATGPSTDDVPLLERDENGVRLRASGSSQTFAAGWREQR